MTTEAPIPSDLSRYDLEVESEPQVEEDEPLVALDWRTGETSAWLVWPIAVGVGKPVTASNTRGISSAPTLGMASNIR